MRPRAAMITQGHAFIKVCIITSGWGQLYPYTADLLCLEACRPVDGSQDPVLEVISTPLVLSAWEGALQLHPDRAFARYVVRGIREGFRIGFQRKHPLQSSQKNMPSAELHPRVIEEYLAKEKERGRLIGPIRSHRALASLHINRFGVIPKGHNTGKWRLITDLSFPDGKSVNDGIRSSLCSLSYITVDDVARIVVQLGRGALLAKMDIESAYRLIPVHPHDRVLQAVSWRGETYVDPMLPFGLRSAPKIFNVVADGLAWHLEQQGIDHILHYLDDFIVVGPPEASVCQQYVDIMERECTRLGVPLAAHKKEGPTTCLTFLGIEIDTIVGELRLPDEKIHRFQGLLDAWGSRSACTRKELESLIGHLTHACKVIRSAKAFLRRMLDLFHSTNRSSHCRTPIRLNSGFRADLAWWRMFMSRWNGISFLTPPSLLPKQHVTSDASGSWGCGAWWKIEWFQIAWGQESQGLSIVEKELIPIVLAGAAWGMAWRNHQVICHCDNMAVVACLKSRSSRVRGVMHLLRCLIFVEAFHQFVFEPQYIDTHANHLADDLSRNRVSSFLSKVPLANRSPSQVSSQFLNLLLDQKVVWTSPACQSLLASIFSRA